MNTFQDYQVWQKAHKLVLEIYKVTKDFPDSEKFGLVAQVRRSSSSICANIAEGYRKSTKDFIRYLDIAQASLEETKYHLILCKDLLYCSEDVFNELFVKTEEVGKMLQGLMVKLRHYK
ncbi:MAG: hypothetical protein A2Z88_04835 [Omnitrophica WOR_2 bacterium GWA2_47_8]|nr:MAG: hypothetical protein A2Z88_04835 [Omnitrophica WOR_2 bacterium GWA2_47_8]